MRAYFFIIVVLSLLAWSEDISPAKYAALVQKGEKVALKLCDEQKLSQIKSNELTVILDQIDSLNPCTLLNDRNKEALAYFIMAGRSNHKHHHAQMNVPNKAKCPVCGMFVSKYPKWAARIEVEDTIHYFDGVKDMMKFYIFNGDFPYDRMAIKAMEVTDFYTLHAIDAKSAFYVVGSNVYGPMGNELIPFATKEAAENFAKDHRAEKIITFTEITDTLVMGLDGL